MKRLRILLLVLFILPFSNLVNACDNSSIVIVSQTTNPDGSITYTLNLDIELGSLDAVYYGSTLSFNSPFNTPTVIIGGPYPTTTSVSQGTLTSGTLSGTLQGLTGGNINSVVMDSDWNTYMGAVNVLSFESAELFGAASNDLSFTVQVTVMGCVESITFDSSVNSGAAACEFTVSTGISCAPCTPPATPTASVTTQPNCTTPTGTITVTAPTGANIQYSVDGVNYQANGTFAGLTPGNYTVTAQDMSTGCVSTSISLTVNAVPSAPATPTASVTTQPDCTTPTGTITITAPTGTNIQYSIDGVNYQANGTFAGLVPGNYTMTAQDMSTGCVSNGVSLTVDPAFGAPATPTATVSAQPNCTTSTGTITVTAPTGATIEYSIDGVNYQASGAFPNLPSGSYTVTAQDINSGCISSGITLIVNPNPNTPATPTASATQPDCDISTGTIVISSPTGATIEYSIDGVNYQTSGTFAGVAPGNYTISAQDVNSGCTSSSIVLSVNTPPSAQDCEPVTCGDLFIPTAFSPNADGNNDSFKIMIEKECVSSMLLRVFDRWGELLFETTDSESAWDGTYKGSKLNSDVFVYTLVIQLTNASEETTYSGNLTLFN